MGMGNGHVVLTEQASLQTGAEVWAEQSRLHGKMAASMKNVEEIRNRVILGEFGVKNVSQFLKWFYGTLTS